LLSLPPSLPPSLPASVDRARVNEFGQLTQDNKESEDARALLAAAAAAGAAPAAGGRGEGEEGGREEGRASGRALAASTLASLRVDDDGKRRKGGKEGGREGGRDVLAGTEFICTYLQGTKGKRRSRSGRMSKRRSGGRRWRLLIKQCMRTWRRNTREERKRERKRRRESSYIMRRKERRKDGEKMEEKPLRTDLNQIVEKMRAVSRHGHTTALYQYPWRLRPSLYCQAHLHLMG